MLSAIVGCTVRVVLKDVIWLSGPVAMSLALVVMILTSTTHPPGDAYRPRPYTLTLTPENQNGCGPDLVLDSAQGRVRPLHPVHVESMELLLSTARIDFNRRCDRAPCRHSEASAAMGWICAGPGGCPQQRAPPAATLDETLGMWALRVNMFMLGNSSTSPRACPEPLPNHDLTT